MEDKRGFTLIELMVVIAIIAILSSILLPTIQNVTVKARNANRMSNLANLESAIQQFNIDNAGFPSTSGAWWGESAGYGTHPHEGASGYVPNLAPVFIRRLPAEPNVGKPNPSVGGNSCDGYLYQSNGLDFKLLSHYCPENPGANYGNEAFKYYDPARPTWAWAIYSANARDW